ncbi:hypothetical protein [Geotalea sp. SG265]|uniref:hypothetical protein n=1 Tax=Geotalea sp. SG265 TaxID=2922867 RepID=UPI001FB03576|nr:hypothetical protein [Geotalea sp. SG265]
MPIVSTSPIAEFLGRAGTIASIATLDEQGAPHAVPSPFLSLDPQGRLVHLELLETSTSHRNLLRSIWFNRPVSITLTNSDREVLVITGKPHKAHVSGPLFSDYYRLVRSRLEDADLAAVWLIEPQQTRDETYAKRKSQEEALHPFHLHLDRLAVTEDEQ